MVRIALNHCTNTALEYIFKEETNLQDIEDVFAKVKYPKCGWNSDSRAVHLFSQS